MLFLNTFYPNPLLIDFGFFDIRYYGLFFMLGSLTGIFLTLNLGKRGNMRSETIIDFAMFALIFGIIGARLYDVFLELPYYINAPQEIFKIYKGGLAIHGGIIGGVIGGVIFARRRNIPILPILAISTPGLALAQAVGRWGNYFNQELFGLPTDLPWGIPIVLNHRPPQFADFTYFHPTFLYESLFLLAFSVTLYTIIKKAMERNETYFHALWLYLIMTGLLRFLLEFIKIDTTPIIFNLRWPQIAGLIMVLAGCIGLIHNSKREMK